VKSPLEDFIAELRPEFAGDIRLDLGSRLLYSTDASVYQIEPLGVLLPRTQDDLRAAVETAANFRIPILPRGAGSSLAGQAVGEAIILDCSRWLDRIVNIEPDQRRATVEPGVVLSNLNREAARFGLQYGPDPASAERATMGGVVGNNATGAHSILYGMTADHVLSADVILADGADVNLGPVKAAEFRASSGTQEGQHSSAQGSGTRDGYREILNAVSRIRAEYGYDIKERFPRTWRNSAGYRLNYLLPWSSARPPEWGTPVYPPEREPDSVNLAALMAGSEGTLAVMRLLTVDLVPMRRNAVLGVLSYDSVEEACDAVPGLLERHPSAIELIPRSIVEAARHVPGYASQAGWVQGDPEALLVVEFTGDVPAQTRAAVQALGANLTLAETVEAQESVWGLRKAGLGILDSRPQAMRSTTFIEDCAIPVENLGDFVRSLQKIMTAHGTQVGIYGHASGGCLHARPLIDLKTIGGMHSLREISEETLEVALSVGGSMASEHGDGIARGQWIRKTYGDRVSKAMAMLKQAADPHGILNPRKMLDAPALDSHLRYGDQYRARIWKPGLDFSRNGGLDTAIEQCNGQAVCRKADGVMCPSFQATREEMHSTRGRANLLRALISRGGNVDFGGRRGDARLEKGVFDALDLCLGCKGCKGECPSAVDMAKMKAAFLEHFYRSHARPLRDYIFGYFHVTARLLAAIGPIANSAERRPALHGLAARVMGISAARPLPRFRRPRGKPKPRSGAKPVVLLRDPFTHYAEAEVEQAAYELLFRGGFEVRTATTIGAGASLISKGFLGAARAHAARVIRDLERLDPSGTVPVLALEPSELSTLRGDYPDLLPGYSGQRMKRVVEARSVEEFLADSGLFDLLRVAIQPTLLVFHPHCHQRADQPFAKDFPAADTLRTCGYEVRISQAGCCGMAGTFGYEVEHYELSQKIARLKLVPQIEAEGGAGVAATGAACRLQIQQATGAAVAHPLVWMWRALERRTTTT
jgi:FAD/FMN-containing dehydrogenase/Fe-S oxidoreductase